MSAALRIARDIGHEQTRFFYAGWSLGRSESEICYRVRFRTDYPNVRDRGYGRNAEVVILAIETEDGNGDWKPARLSSAQWDAIVDQIESDEIGVD